MKCDKKMMLLYAVTDRAWVGKQTLYEQVESALKGGVTCVQLREKNQSEEEFLREALEISSLCKKYNVPFIVNDNVKIAVKCNATGVHVGQDDCEVSEVRKLVGDKMIIGVSAHNVEEAKKAVASGADYLGVGAVFSTSTKADTNVLSFETVKAISDAVNVPIVAIGGINRDNILKLKGTGVDGAAIVSGIFAAEDIEEECKTLRKLSEEMVSP